MSNSNFPAKGDLNIYRCKDNKICFNNYFISLEKAFDRRDIYIPSIYFKLDFYVLLECEQTLI